MHVLVIPVAHRPTILDLAPEEHEALMRTLTTAARTARAAADPDGIAIRQSNGIAATQSIPHLHFHVAATLPEGGTDWGTRPSLGTPRSLMHP